jgi:hypothetical protein
VEAVGHMFAEDRTRTWYKSIFPTDGDW